MKVLHIGKYFPPRYGGIETFMSQLMEEQVIQGLKVAAIVHADELQSESGHYQWRGCEMFEVKSYGQLFFVPVAPAFILILRSCLNTVKPDVIHIHMPNVSAFWLFFLKLYSAKLIIHWHSDVLGANPTKAIRLLYPVYRLFEKRLLRKADKIIATSPAYLATSEALNGFKDKSEVVPLGIKLEQAEVTSVEESSGLSLLMIGRLTYYKNHSLVISTLSGLVKKDRTITLKIIGTGELETSLREQIQLEGLEDNVRLQGRVTEAEKQQYLHQSDVLLLPSSERTEAFGVVLLEAASHAKPAIVSDVEGSGMTYVVEHGHNGYVVPANDRQQLAETLIQCSQERVKLREMGRANLQKLKRCFDISIVAKKILAVYEEPET